MKTNQGGLEDHQVHPGLQPCQEDCNCRPGGSDHNYIDGDDDNGCSDDNDDSDDNYDDSGCSDDNVDSDHNYKDVTMTITSTLMTMTMVAVRPRLGGSGLLLCGLSSRHVQAPGDPLASPSS